ncbi:hypothetical protein Micbo1qcDRAFT_213046 [Microdochium bolleyi]|uniref:Uncharacterized protein n=1 Tax=Microdochium bolleyi TaxID=196109 RepID=A0A136IX88_9PEZI|nr:hypothetical protein Micbo1qcDRAFT_213046 [Microdochium bolleyi]
MALPTPPSPPGDDKRRTVLITGCSRGGIGDALARAFHRRGDCRVFATARDPRKIAHMSAADDGRDESGLGIETLVLDVTSPASIAACVARVDALTRGRGLDVLVNNSGGGASGPLVETDEAAARQIFEVNFWAVLAVSRAFLPLLLKAVASRGERGVGNGGGSHGGGKGEGAMIVNNTSVGSLVPLAWQGVYSASKAATAMMSEQLRLELAPLGVAVVDVKTGGVRSNFHGNQLGGAGDGGGGGHESRLVPGSLYEDARVVLDEYMSGREAQRAGMEADVYARMVVGDLLGGGVGREKAAPRLIWRGTGAGLGWFGLTFFPYAVLERLYRHMANLDVVDKKIKEAKASRTKP